MAINYRKLVEKTDFDLWDLLKELAFPAGGRDPSPPPVQARGKMAVVTGVEWDWKDQKSPQGLCVKVDLLTVEKQ